MKLLWIVALSPLFMQAQQAARFHHVAMNVTDAAAAIEFLTKRFDCEPGKFATYEDAVWTQKSWILFTKVAAPPPYEIVSTIWHMGWSAEDMPAAYQKQIDMGTPFQTPLTDISRLANFDGFYYAYVDGPNHALIELNTAQHHRFGHIHLLSDDPVAAGQWYAEHFGVFVYDHIGLSVDDIDATVKRLKSEGVKVIGSPSGFRNTSQRAVMIEGPDHLSIQLVEGHAHKE